MQVFRVRKQRKHPASAREALAHDPDRTAYRPGDPDMQIPGLRLHLRKGKAHGRWSDSVSGNWRVTIEFRDRHCYVLDYEGYHR